MLLLRKGGLLSKTDLAVKSTCHFIFPESSVLKNKLSICTNWVRINFIRL